jgi:hypothetical protein
LGEPEGEDQLSEVEVKEAAMKKNLGFIVSVMIMTSFPLVAQPAVNATYDHTYDFSRVKTFVVEVKTPWGDPTTEAYAKEAVAKELGAKGWTRASTESSADVLVVINGAPENKEITESLYSGTGTDPNGCTGPAGVSNTRIVQEKLGEGTINIFDVKTKALVFTGKATGEISNQDKKNEEKIKKAVEKVFKSFVPRTGA